MMDICGHCETTPWRNVNARDFMEPYKSFDASSERLDEPSKKGGSLLHTVIVQQDILRIFIPNPMAKDPVIQRYGLGVETFGFGKCFVHHVRRWVKIPRIFHQLELKTRTETSFLRQSSRTDRMPPGHVLLLSGRSPLDHLPDHSVADMFAVVFCTTLSAKHTRNCGI